MIMRAIVSVWAVFPKKMHVTHFDFLYTLIVKRIDLDQGIDTLTVSISWNSSSLWLRCKRG